MAQPDSTTGFFDHDGARIRYEVTGSGFPLLLIAPGGMRSAIEFWDSTPWDPREQLADRFTVVAMDQRNAGESTGPVRESDGWGTMTADQLALMDHLGFDRFHVAGMCIGGPYILGLIEAAPERVVTGVLFQTIGRDENREAFYDMYDGWADALRPVRDDVSDAAWDGFREAMYGGDKVFFNVDEDFVRQVEHPLLVLLGSDLYHPTSSSLLIAELAPNATLIEDWKQGPGRDAAMTQFASFLVDHTPAD